MTYNGSASTQFEDCKKLLSYLAYKCSQRLYALGFEADVDDLFQDACVVYTKAVEAFNPEVGAPFQAYLKRAVLLGFNNKVEHMLEVRKSVKFVSVVTDEESDIGGMDFIKSSEDTEAFNDTADNVEELAIRSDEIRERVGSLSPMAKLVVRELISPSLQVTRTMQAMQAHADFGQKTLNQRLYRPKEVNIRVIRKHYGINPKQYARLKEEFLTKLGVTIGNE